jgi:hypothetical protein
VFNYVVLRNRGDLRVDAETILFYPFYRTLGLLFRLHALLYNIVVYTAFYPKPVKISTRVDSVKDIPPVRWTRKLPPPAPRARDCARGDF